MKWTSGLFLGYHKDGMRKIVLISLSRRTKHHNEKDADWLAVPQMNYCILQLTPEVKNDGKLCEANKTLMRAHLETAGS